MISFKQFLEADAMDLASMDAPQPDNGQQAPTSPQTSGNKLKGSLTDGEKRVLALLSTNQMKSAPGRARELISGDRNMVQAVKALKINFKAVDVKPDGIIINQVGTNLATNQGIVDANSGELTDLGQKLVTTSSTGHPNPKTKELAAPSGGDMGGAPAPMPPI